MRSAFVGKGGRLDFTTVSFESNSVGAAKCVSLFLSSFMKISLVKCLPRTNKHVLRHSVVVLARSFLFRFTSHLLLLQHN